MYAMILDNVRHKVESIDSIKKAEVELVWNPPWTPDRISKNNENAILAGPTMMRLLFIGIIGLMIFMIAIPLDMSASFMKILRSHPIRLMVLLIVYVELP